MLSNMASSLIMHKRIFTTTAKAKALKRYIEPLITRSKEDSTHSRRIVFSYLQDKEAVTELFREVALKVGERPGGYTRIIRTGGRVGDNADMCMMELVDYNPTMLAEKADTKKTSRRRRGGRGKSAEAKATPPPAKAPEAPEAEVPETAAEVEAPEAEEPLAEADQTADAEIVDEADEPEGDDEPDEEEDEEEDGDEEEEEDEEEDEDKQDA